ncbi:MAG: aminotransferase class IV [Clostridiales bacterium]|nr:aminotransferase class IV [Clostridiales bacterium]
MAYPLMEHPSGDSFFFDGAFYDVCSDKAQELSRPTDDRTYYETVRIKRGVLLFLEDHMARLTKSVAGLEDFPVDTKDISDKAYLFLKEIGFKADGNIRIVLTKEHLLIHLVDVNVPDKEKFEKGINTCLFQWERQTPNLKIFRGDYKNAVNEKFKTENAHGKPFELVLSDNEGKLYEGSMSNLFVIMDGAVYSAPDDKILIGITRRRVIEALKRSGLELKTGMFTMDELIKGNAAIFVSSTPFDILPVTYIDDHSFNSVNDPLLNMISKAYAGYTEEYIADHLEVI